MNILKLKGKMVEKGINVDELSKKIGVDRATLYRKFRSVSKFNICDAQKIKDELGLSIQEASEIFFD